jgi:uncharacterized repeat protein (TIGR01451 family)
MRTCASRSRSSVSTLAATVVGALALAAIASAPNTASAATDPSDLAVTKVVDNPTPNVGDNVTFTVTFTNNGPDPAGGTAVTDTLPAGLTFVSATPSQGTYDPSGGFWVVGTLANGATVTLQIVAQVAAPGLLTNVATVTGSDQTDPDSSNNSASATVTATGTAPSTTTTTIPPPDSADLAVAKTVDDPAPEVGSNVTFTVTVVNNGPDEAGNILVSDVLPAGLTLVSATASTGVYPAANQPPGTWFFQSLGSAASATLQIVALVTGPGVHTNTASITLSSPADLVSANNSASLDVTATPAGATSTSAPATTSVTAPPPTTAAAAQQPALPRTGWEGGPVVVVAVIIVLAGLVMAMTSRRRSESS